MNNILSLKTVGLSYASTNLSFAFALYFNVLLYHNPPLFSITCRTCPNVFLFGVQIPVDAYSLFGLKRRSFLFVIDIKTHAKGAYKTPPRVSFSMQNRGELPFLWQFTLFVVSSRIAVGICSSLALGNRKPLTIVQKGFLHDKERMISSVLINEKMTDRTLTNAVGRFLIRFPLPVFRTRNTF